MKKILWVTNLLTLATLVGILIRDEIRREAPEPCYYPLDAYDFHFKKETDKPAIIMLGNSLMRHASWDSLLHRTDIINRGISGDNLHCIYQRLAYLTGTSAKICFIEGGVNDLPAQNIDTLFHFYQRIVEFWKSQHVIPVVNLVVYISPRAGKIYEYRHDYKAINTLTRTLNDKIRKFAVQNNIDFIDLNTVLCDEKELFLKEEFTPDGIHLTQPAYTIWANEITAILNKHGIVEHGI